MLCQCLIIFIFEINKSSGIDHSHLHIRLKSVPVPDEVPVLIYECATKNPQVNDDFWALQPLHRVVDKRGSSKPSSTLLLLFLSSKQRNIEILIKLHAIIVVCIKYMHQMSHISAAWTAQV